MAERYLAALPILNDSENHSLRENLIRVATGQVAWRSELATKAQELISAHKKALAEAETQRDKKALEIICAALTEQGIVVGPIAQTMYVEGGDVYFTHETWDPGYYARLRIQPAKNRMAFQMVKTTGPLTNDKAMEEHFCVKLKSVIETAKAKELDAQFVELKSAGTVPMVTISSDLIPAYIRQSAAEADKGTQPAAYEEQVRSLNQP